ncbi:hypothetical protein SMSP1_01914 [Sedimentisphaera salicampi]|nr:hypothetical protein SMSP1_01914 [Sedimentisphaera salicampi]
MNRISAIFDYFFGSCPDQDKETIRKSIEERSDCSRFYKNLKKSLEPLNTLKEEPCPDYLVKNVLARTEKSGSQTDLELLLEKESAAESDNIRFWNKVGRIAAAAAMIAIIAATYFPATQKMRAVADSIACKHNLARIGTGLHNYAFDNAGMMPLASSGSDSWWKVGSQREDEYSNTRNAWLLVKNGYCQMEDFECPARPIKAEAKLERVDVCDYEHDFPHKEFINYSFPVISKNVKLERENKRAIAADSNPLFEGNCLDQQTFFKTVRLDEKMKNFRSINHNGAGQNILLLDNSVKFSRNSFYNGDNFYTVEGLKTYSGNERPSDKNDTFLAP